MHRPYQILLPLFSLFLVRVELTDLWPLQYQVEVVKILDADTIEVLRGKQLMRIRLAKIDAPEKGQPFWHEKGDAGEAATRCARKFIRPGQPMTLTINKLDIYRRVLGDLDDLSLKLITHGCVSLYPYAQFADQREKFRYLRAQQKARRQGRGLWQQGGYLQPKLWRQQQQRHRGKLASKPNAGRR